MYVGVRERERRVVFCFLFFCLVLEEGFPKRKVASSHNALFGPLPLLRSFRSFPSSSLSLLSVACPSTLLACMPGSGAPLFKSLACNNHRQCVIYCVVSKGMKKKKKNKPHSTPQSKLENKQTIKKKKKKARVRAVSFFFGGAREDISNER